MSRPTSPSVTAADLDARCTDLRRAGLTYRQIGARLGISPAQAHKRVARTLDRTRREPGDALRELELERLDALQVRLTQVLERDHLTVSAGRVVTTGGDDGQAVPLLDDGPTIAAAQALVRVQESRRRLLGMDAPERHDVRAQVHSVDQLDMQIAELENLLAVEDPDYAAGERRRKDRDARIERFRLEWSRPGRAQRDPAGLLGQGMELALHLLDLSDAEREAAAVEVEALLMRGAR
jgi:hypothetical protein